MGEELVTAYEVEIRITPRRGILDPEGRTIQRALGDLGYAGLEGVRSGRLVRLRLEAADSASARELATDMCEKLIANPVIEDYAILVEPALTEGS